MLRVRSTVAAGACVAVLASCGSTAAQHTKGSKAAAINAELRRLQIDIDALRHMLGGHRGGVELVYKAPKGVSVGEWQTAIRKDQALQRVIAATRQSK